ncbi:MAG: Asp-tRNA(Asn)/Glu-tRNA(Gln) amidotransferase subunit GatC [Bacilli bacterium]|nr:Asp-tRNA(Asn)/Glu-tRNA(Gln) amidotransferase subunit GatC [Bacilli bacterium]
MKKFTEEMVIDYADKLLIGLTDDEVKMVLDEFEIIDKNIDIINTISDIEKVEPMTHCLDDFKYSLREDIAEESIDIDDLLSNCKETANREVKVPKVVE